jgi:transcriptional regulator with XRE-family HTH domain
MPKTTPAKTSDRPYTAQGKRLRSYRKLLNISQGQAARSALVEREWWTKLESGFVGLQKYEKRAAVASVLGLDMETFARLWTPRGVAPARLFAEVESRNVRKDHVQENAGPHARPQS